MTNYRCVVTLTNSSHKIIRMAKYEMAKLITAFRCKQRDPWLTPRYEATFSDLGLLPNMVKSLLFINEWNGERLEIS